MKVVKSKSEEFSSQGKKPFFYFFNFISLRDDGCSLNFLQSLFHDACKSNHHAVYLKFTQDYMSIIFQ